MGAGGNLRLDRHPDRQERDRRQGDRGRRLATTGSPGRLAARRRFRHQLQHPRSSRRGDAHHRWPAVSTSLYDNIANPQVLPLAFHAIGIRRTLGHRRRPWRPNVTIDFSHLYHKQITIRAGPAIRRRTCRTASPPRRGQDQGPDRMRAAAVAGARSASHGRSR